MPVFLWTCVCLYPCVSMCALSCVAVFGYIDVHLCVCRKHTEKWNRLSRYESVCITDMRGYVVIFVLVCVCLRSFLPTFVFVGVYMCHSPCLSVCLFSVCLCYFLCVCYFRASLCASFCASHWVSVHICLFYPKGYVCVSTRRCLTVRVSVSICVCAYLCSCYLCVYALVDAYVRVCLSVRVSMFVCVCWRVCVFIRNYLCEHVFKCVCVCALVPMCLRALLSVFVCVSVFMCVYMSVFVRFIVRICICGYVPVFVRVHVCSYYCIFATVCICLHSCET